MLIHLLFILTCTEYLIYMIPLLTAMLYAHFGCQCVLLVTVWKVANASQYSFDQHYFSEIFKIFSKFYFITLLFFLVMVKVMLMDDMYLVIVFGPIWVPQIFWNFFNRARRSPLLKFAYASTAFHIFFPCYLRLVSTNFLYLKPKLQPCIRIFLL